MVGGLQGTTTVCAQPGLHYRSKSTGGGATGVTDLTFVCVVGGGLLLHQGKRKGGGGAAERRGGCDDFHTHSSVM